MFTLAHAYRWAVRTTTQVPGSRLRLPTPARIAAATGAVALVATVTLGAAHYGGTTHPPGAHRTSATR